MSGSSDRAEGGRSGLLPVDKPAGPTSHDVVARARKALGERRVGHTGTLDPFASGLLLLLIGPATRLSEYITGLDKTYEATARLGVSTDTLDPEGEPLERDEAWRALGEDEVRGALESLRGRHPQVPPRYSAKKVRGETAHRRVRRGESVELDAVEVEIHEIELLEVLLPEVRFRLRSSSGTYVRAVARDLGVRLGTAAHLTALRRTGVGSFRVEDALPDAALESAGGTGEGPSVLDRVSEVWVPAVAALRHLPVLEVDESAEEDLRHGRPVALPHPEEGAPGGGSEAPSGGPEAPEGAPIALVRGGRLLAVGERLGARIQPRKVFRGG